MFKYTTQFRGFRFNSVRLHGTETVTWFVLVQGKNQLDEGRCFTDSELIEFKNFMLSKPYNFPSEGKDEECNQDDTPFCGGVAGLTPRRSTETRPINITLRSEPKLNDKQQIMKCMDVILLNNGNADNHAYNLEFDVIGVLHKPR